MTFHTPILPESTESRWDSAITAVNAFRGAIIHHHSVAEVAVSEALLAIHEALQGAGRPRLQLLVGQRFEALRTHLDTSPIHGEAGVRALAVLRNHQPFEGDRAIFCHGAAAVTLDRANRWCLGLRMIAFRSSQPQRTCLLIREQETAALLSALSASSRRVVSALMLLRGSLAGT